MTPRITYANVVSTLALVLVVSGGAYAATQLPKDSVGSKQIKNNTVKAKDVKDGTLGAADVKDGTLGAADVQDGSLGAADVQDGSLTRADVKAGELLAAINGTPMDGDLTGTFPNPTLDPALLAGLATDAEVDSAVDSAVDDLREDVVIGERASGSAFLLAGAGDVELVSIPDVVTVSASCFEAGPNQGMNVEVVNETPATDWDYVLSQQSQVPALNTIASGDVGSGNDVDLAFPPDTNTQSARYLRLTVYDGTPVTIEVAGITSTLAGNCVARASVMVDDGPV